MQALTEDNSEHAGALACVGVHERWELPAHAKARWPLLIFAMLELLQEAKGRHGTGLLVSC